MEGTIKNPVDPRLSFQEQTKHSLESQVTFFMLLGALYSPNRPNVLKDALQLSEEFPIPPPQIFNPFEVQESVQMFEEKYRFYPLKYQIPFEQETLEIEQIRRKATPQLVDSLYKKADPRTIVELILMGMSDPNEFIRTAAAISFIDLFDNIEPAINVLFAVIEEPEDVFVRQLAGTALRRMRHQFMPNGYGSYGKGQHNGDNKHNRDSKENNAIIVPGTFFGRVGTPIADWWKPGGSFHTYIKNNFRSSLYNRPDYFQWSGGWSDQARRLAAEDLWKWGKAKNTSNLDVLAHSHGGNVVMWATQLGLQIEHLILLSCPAHTKRYLPEFSRVKKVTSYQIKLDWVILADGGGIYFNHPSIDDQVLPVWFLKHDDTHSENIWRKYGLTI